MSRITPALLAAVGADAKGAVLYGSHLAAAADRRGVTSSNAIIAGLANWLHESNGLRCVSEDMYYLSAAYIAAVFRSRFPGGAAEAARFTRNPKALGDRVYASIGKIAGGYAARGLGLGQNTGDANHGAYAENIGMSLADARAHMLTPPGAADSAVWYFVARGCAVPAEAGNLLRVRQIWAGNSSPAPIGWLDPKDRRKPGPVQLWAAKVRAALGAAPASPTAPVDASNDQDAMSFPP